MKKLLTFFLACAVLLAVTVPAYAVEYTETVETYGTTESPGKKIIIQGDETLMLVTTPIECTEEALHPEIQKMLAAAWVQINAAGTLADLTPGIIPALEKVKANSSDPMVKRLTVKDLVICDLFDVSLIKNKTEFIHSEPGKTLTFSVETNLRPGDIFFIMHNYEGTSWEMVTRYDLSDNGVLLIALDSLSPMAIAVPVYYNMSASYSGPVSPQTDDRSVEPAVLHGTVMACMTLAVLCGAVYSRRKRLFQKVS